MPSRVSAFVIWALLAASLVFWALRLTVRGPSAPPFTVPVGEAAAVRGDRSRLFGSGATAAPAVAAPQAASRFRLLGVAAPPANAPQGSGIALLSIEGKPARPYRVGAHVDGELMLRAVGPRSATLGPASGENAFTLELPLRPLPARGSLPAISPDGQSQAPQPAPAPPSENDEPVEQPQPPPQALPPPGRPPASR
jgi:general secretion pathway protein C